MDHPSGARISLDLRVPHPSHIHFVLCLLEVRVARQPWCGARVPLSACAHKRGLTKGGDTHGLFT